MLTMRNANLATMSEGCAVEKVADATRKGYLSPAMRDWAIGLCRSDEASFDSFIATSIPQFAHLMQPSRFTGTPPAARGASTADSEAAAAICTQAWPEAGRAEPLKLAGRGSSAADLRDGGPR